MSEALFFNRRSIKSPTKWQESRFTRRKRREPQQSLKLSRLLHPKKLRLQLVEALSRTFSHPSPKARRWMERPSLSLPKTVKSSTRNARRRISILYLPRSRMVPPPERSPSLSFRAGLSSSLRKRDLRWPHLKQKFVEKEDPSSQAPRPKQLPSTTTSHCIPVCTLPVAPQLSTARSPIFLNLLIVLLRTFVAPRCDGTIS